MLINLSDCTGENPLSDQLTRAIPGFNWKKEQYGPMVSTISRAFMIRHNFVGSVEVDDGRCGFCGKTGIATEYYFRDESGSQSVIHAGRHGTVYDIVMPSLLVTGSKCKEFPRLSELARRNFNNVFRGLHYTDSTRDALFRILDVTMHPNLLPEKYRSMMLYMPINYIAIDERSRFIYALLTRYKYFIFAKRKRLPSDMPLICLHSEYKHMCKWYPKEAYDGQDKDVVFGIPFWQIIEFGRIIPS